MIGDIPQEPRWPGWGFREALAEESLVQRSERLGRLVQPVPAEVPIAQPPSSTDPKREAAVGAPTLVTEPGVGLASTNAPAAATPDDEQTDPRAADPSPTPGGCEDIRGGNPFAGIPDDE